MYVCVYVCMYVRTYIYTYIYIHKIAYATAISVLKYSFEIFANDQVV